MPFSNDPFGDLNDAGTTLVGESLRSEYLNHLQNTYKNCPQLAGLSAIAMIQAANQFLAVILEDDNYRDFYNMVIDAMADDHADISKTREQLREGGLR